MNRRARVLTALEHKEPDRIPVDLGGMDSTGITALAYNNLKKHLGITTGKTQVYDPYQQVTRVEPAILEIIGADVLPIPLEPRQWKFSTLPDGSACEVPEKWNPRKLDDGSWVIMDEAGVITARMPAGGFYFESLSYPLQKASSVKEIEDNLACIETFDLPGLCDESYDDLRKKAQHLYEHTDYALMGNFAVHIYAAGQFLRGFEQFMMDLVINPAIAECIMDHLADTFIKRFDQYHQAIGEYIHIINVNDDLGLQESLQIAPSLYRKLVKPYHQRLYQHIKKSSDLYLFLHTDGSVYDIIPDLIEIGVDILNPVQFNCKNMELPRLKREFGQDIVFWGGGCDTQKVLPVATPAEVKKHVRECISVLAPGGGFVFNQLHNIQPDVPPENIMAMYEAVKEYQGAS